MPSAPHSFHLTFLDNQARVPSAARLFIVAAVLVVKWDHYRKTRRVLKALEPHLLADVGLTRDLAQSEAAKPFWKD